MTVKQAVMADLQEAARLALLLWPEYDPAELAPLLDSPEAAVFL